MSVKSSENYRKQTMKCYCFGYEKQVGKEINPSFWCFWFRRIFSHITVKDKIPPYLFTLLNREVRLLKGQRWWVLYALRWSLWAFRRLQVRLYYDDFDWVICIAWETHISFSSKRRRHVEIRRQWSDSWRYVTLSWASTLNDFESSLHIIMNRNDLWTFFLERSQWS